MLIGDVAIVHLAFALGAQERRVDQAVEQNDGRLGAPGSEVVDSDAIRLADSTAPGRPRTIHLLRRLLLHALRVGGVLVDVEVRPGLEVGELEAGVAREVGVVRIVEAHG